MPNTTGDNDDNTLNGTPQSDTIDGKGGDDDIYGGAGNDTLYGGKGDDKLYAGDGFDKLYGGQGDDLLVGGGDNDELYGGDDSDRFIINSLGSAGVNNTTVNGGSGGNDDDSLNIEALIKQGFEVKNFVKNPENNGQPGFNGQIQLYNATTGQHANINFHDIEKFVICFTPGTLIATPKGEVPVESLREGDKVFTRDNGVQEIRWTGRRDLTRTDLAAAASLRPVRVRAGALGRGLPERDLVVSPSHRLLMWGPAVTLDFGETEVLAAAKHLTARDGIDRAETGAVSYIHLMFDHHEVILSNGAWTESFQPGDHSLQGLGQAQRDEIFALFPELAGQAGLREYGAARRALKRHEAALLTA